MRLFAFLFCIFVLQTHFCKRFKTKLQLLFKYLHNNIEELSFVYKNIKQNQILVCRCFEIDFFYLFVYLFLGLCQLFVVILVEIEYFWLTAVEKICN